MNRKIEIYSSSRIEEMILGGVDDEVMVKEGWKGSKKEFETIYLQFHQNWNNWRK